MVAKAEHEGWLQQHSLDDLAAFYGYAFDIVCAAALLHTRVHQAKLSGEVFIACQAAFILGPQLHHLSTVPHQPADETAALALRVCAAYRLASQEGLSHISQMEKASVPGAYRHRMKYGGFTVS